MIHYENNIATDILSIPPSTLHAVFHRSTSSFTLHIYPSTTTYGFVADHVLRHADHVSLVWTFYMMSKTVFSPLSNPSCKLTVEKYKCVL